jgi:hypothetical protein
LGAHIGRRALRGARIGLIAGLCLASLYLVLGIRGNELTEVLGYSLLVVGFPAMFVIESVLQWSGIQGGMREYVLLVVLALSLNGCVWGTLLGTILTAPSLGGRQGGRGA